MDPTDGRARGRGGGGSTIPAQVAKAIIGVLDFHLPAQEAIALPVIVAPGGDPVYLESGTFLAAMSPQLQALGHKIDYRPPRLSRPMRSSG